MYNLTNCRINITADPERAKASGEEIDRKRFVEEFSLLMTVKKRGIKNCMIVEVTEVDKVNNRIKSTQFEEWSFR